MEMEGRSFSEMYRNTSEEMFIKTMMESPVGMAAPTMEMLGFKNITQGFRADSEEIFKSWLTTGENSGCHATGIGHRPPRQASRRISTELASLCNQNAAANAMQKKVNDDTFPETTTTTDFSNERSGVEKGAQATNLFLAKAWFHSCQPMTRSRSSELRRRYVAMQNSQTQIGIEACAKQQQQTDEANGFNFEENHPTHFNGFMSFNNNNILQQGDSVDKISSVVSMLKGTLDRKKLTNQVDKEGVEESSLGYYTASCFNQGPFQDGSLLGDDETRALQTIEESLMEGIIGPLNHPTQISNRSREASQSESSAVVVSNGFDMFDDHCISTQAPTLSDTSRNQMGTEDCSRTRDVRERIYDHTREDQKQESLVRYGSIKSSGSVERGDPTKKRRVERSRKMAEAKEKSSTPPVPSDVQSILKRCENLEKEVRSLKLNLAFMNRKDSEQTKQIEELQKENQELADEKERLLEEIERIISETGKM